MLQNNLKRFWALMLIISKLVETKTNFNYLIGYLDKPIRPSVLIMPKISEYVKTLKLNKEIKIKAIN